MNLKIFLLWLGFSCSLFAQQKDEELDTYIDYHYFEDQFYLGIQYDLNINNSNGIENTGVPFSLQTGFIKDIPVNKRRNKALGLGIGYSFDVIRPNILMIDNGNSLVFNIDNSYSRYDYTSHNIEFPLEYRWRTSNAINNNFWRIYSGVSFIYNIHNSASFDDNNGNTTEFANISALNESNYSIYTSIGFGTWNFHIKYLINPYFKSSIRTETGEKIRFNQLKLGVMFYIL